VINITTDFVASCKFMIISQAIGLRGLNSDGLMGLGADTSSQNIIDLAYQAGYLASDLFGFYMDKDNSSTLASGNSYMTIGFVPDEFNGKINFVDVTFDGYWAADLIGVDIDGKSEFENGAKYALFDTGTSYLILTTNNYKAFARSLLANGCERFSGMYYCDCALAFSNVLPVITIYTRGMAFNITASDYMIYGGQMKSRVCAVAVTGGAESMGFVILGDVFIRKNFVVYSKSNQTIGIANADLQLERLETEGYYLTGVMMSLFLGLSLVLSKVAYIRQVKKMKQVNLETRLLPGGQVPV